jgi:hypothetical protein
MKGITIIVILSIVGSIVSGIMEKRKAAAAKKARSASLGSSPQPAVKTQWKADPVAVKIESLRRRHAVIQEKSVPKPDKPLPKPDKLTPIPVDFQKIKPIAPLHVEDCPLPPTQSRARASKAPSIQLASMLRNQRNIRTAIVLSEILGKPISQRN